jgi:hypothetical protein
MAAEAKAEEGKFSEEKDEEDGREFKDDDEGREFLIIPEALPSSPAETSRLAAKLFSHVLSSGSIRFRD